MTRQIVNQETLVIRAVQQAITDASPKRFSSELERQLAYSQRVVDLETGSVAANPPMLGEPSVVYSGTGDWGSVDLWNGVDWKPLQAVSPEDAGLVTLEIADATAIAEPLSGQTFASFLVTLTGTPRSKISVNYIAEELNPLAEYDQQRRTNPDPSNARYLTDFGDALGNTLVFDPDDRATDNFGDQQTSGDDHFYTATIRVPVYADVVAEAQERFQVRLFGAHNARVDRAIGVAVIGEANLPIVNIYDAPDVVTTNAPTSQGSTEVRIRATTATFTVKLETGTAPVGGISFTAELGDITAMSGVDYSPLGATTYTIPEGSSSVNIVVAIPAQAAESRDESFYCRITPATGVRALFARRYATAVIKGTDTRSTFYMDSLAAGDWYTDENPTHIFIPWYLSPAATSDVYITFWTELNLLHTTPRSQLNGLFPWTLRENPLTIRIRRGTTSGTLRLRVNSFFRHWTDSNGAVTTPTTETLEFRVLGYISTGSSIARVHDSLGSAEEGVSILSVVELGITGSDDQSGQDASDPPQVTIEAVGSPGAESDTPAQFVIRLSRSPSSNVRVNWATQTGGTLGNATAGSDFLPASGFVEWVRGATTGLEHTVSVEVVPDALNEQDEYFTVALSDLTGTAELSIPSASYTILGTATTTNPNEIAVAPSFRIDAPNTGVRDVSIVAIPSRVAPAGGLTANVAYNALTATENTHYRVTPFGDFPGSPTTLSWPAGTKAPVDIGFQILDAPVTTPVEFEIVITLPPEHSDWVSGGRCRVVIAPQVPLSRRLPRLSVGNVTRDEDAVGAFQFPFTLDEAPGDGRSASVDFTTIGQSARPGDYGLPTGNPQGHSVTPSGEIYGTILFTGSDDRKLLDLAVTQDSDVENDESFLVRASNPIGCLIVQADGRGRITNDDVPTRTAASIPRMTIDPGEIVGSDMVFRIRLDRRPSSEVTLAVGTVGGTARDGTDYNRVHRRLTIPVGVTTTIVRVPLLRLTAGLSSKQFQLRASDIRGATPSVIDATGTIPAATVAPTDILSIAAGAVPTERGGTQTFVVSRSALTTRPASVGVITIAGTGRPGIDFVALERTLFFRPSVTQQSVVVSTVRPAPAAPGLSVQRPRVTYRVALVNPSGSALSPTAASATGTVPAWP